MGERVRRTTCQVLPPSEVEEIVPCSRQCEARLRQPSQPVPRTPCVLSRKATALGTRAERGSGVEIRAGAAAVSESARNATAATSIATLVLMAAGYASGTGR